MVAFPLILKYHRTVSTVCGRDALAELAYLPTDIVVVLAVRQESASHNHSPRTVTS
jgi:hypothetical protein